LAYSSNWASLENQLKLKVSDTLRTNVFEEVKKVEQEHIQSDVYDVYSPFVYERRGYSGGIIADENIILTEIDNFNIEVVNITDPNPYARDGATIDKFLPELIEYGNGNDNYYDYPAPDARPYIANTKEDLAQNKQHIKAMCYGLKQRGIDII
jgi:hypothetical protein